MACNRLKRCRKKKLGCESWKECKKTWEWNKKIHSSSGRKVKEEKSTPKPKKGLLLKFIPNFNDRVWWL